MPDVTSSHLDVLRQILIFFLDSRSRLQIPGTSHRRRLLLSFHRWPRTFLTPTYRNRASSRGTLFPLRVHSDICMCLAFDSEYIDILVKSMCNGHSCQ